MPFNQKMTLALFMLACVITGCSVENGNDRLNEITVEATGDNFNWFFRYPGVDGVLGTDDDHHSTQHLYVPDNAAVTIKLNSKDYIYSFALPELGLKEVAIPDLSFELQFNSDSARTLTLLGDQFCGFSHNSLIGEVRIVDQDNGFYGWQTKLHARVDH